MGTILNDKLTNLVANLGTERDKAYSSYYAPTLVTDQQLQDAYRFAWLPRKIVDVPALDACRKWRNWQADSGQIELIEAEEKRLGLRGKVLDAMTKARLFGGAAIYIGTGESNPAKPLNPATIKRGGIKHLTVLTRRKLFPTELETDPLSERFGKPKAYTMAGMSGTIHPSRLVIFIGNPHPDEDLAVGLEFGWGDSVLQAVFEAVKNSDATAANIASLVFEAKVDVISIPDFMQSLQDPAYEKQVLDRLRLAAQAKGINGTLILDALEKYDQKSANFSNLTDILMAFLQIVSGAADIPMTRLLGQSPGGMNATGDSDTRNYYDRISAMQELEIGPAMSVLDECLIRSAMGSRPADVHYVWGSLWQATAVELANIGKTTAETIKTLADTKLIPEEALSQAAVSMLVENSVMPGLESAMADYAAGLLEELPTDEVDPVEPVKVADAAPRSLYVSRQLLNVSDVLAWAKAQGFETTLPGDDMHVTIAFSREPVDWLKVGTAWAQDDAGRMRIAPGGARVMERFGDAVVLLFNSSELAWRHMSIREAGASWDHPEYQPHITISYAFTGDLSAVEPYRGAIELGPELFAEVRADWKDTVRETD